jgi:hypothetical protein
LILVHGDLGEKNGTALSRLDFRRNEDFKINKRSNSTLGNKQKYSYNRYNIFDVITNKLLLPSRELQTKTMKMKRGKLVEHFIEDA